MKNCHKGEPPPTHRSIQDANYNNQIVKERTGASLTSLSSTCLLWQFAKAKCPNRQGPNSFCSGTPHGVPAIEPGLWLFWSAIFYRSTNQQSIAHQSQSRLRQNKRQGGNNTFRLVEGQWGDQKFFGIRAVPLDPVDPACCPLRFPASQLHQLASITRIISP